MQLINFKRSNCILTHVFMETIASLIIIRRLAWLIKSTNQTKPQQWTFVYKPNNPINYRNIGKFKHIGTQNEIYWNKRTPLSLPRRQNRFSSIKPQYGARTIITVILQIYISHVSFPLFIHTRTYITLSDLQRKPPPSLTRKIKDEFSLARSFVAVRI